MSRTEKRLLSLQALEDSFESELLLALEQEADTRSGLLFSPSAMIPPDWPHVEPADEFFEQADEILSLRRDLSLPLEPTLAFRYLEACRQHCDITDHHRPGAGRVARHLLDDFRMGSRPSKASQPSADISVLHLFDPQAEVSRSVLESFIGYRLADAGVWDAPRTSDGIRVLREIERTEFLARLCGQIWSIDQTLHTFWLDIERSRHELDWTLYFDPLIDSPRAARNACYALARPDEAQWRAALSGKVSL